MKNTKKTITIDPFSEYIDLEQGTLKNPKVHNIRRASDMVGYYKDEAALQDIIDQGDSIHYETFESNIPEESGHLIYGLTTLYPGIVGQECFMTKGHYHNIVETAEIYLCLRGEGYLLMKTPDGKVKAEPMSRGRMVYVPPYWAHRSVNTEHSKLTMVFVYPAYAGHNYGDIKTEGFIKRIFKKKGGIVIE